MGKVFRFGVLAVGSVGLFALGAASAIAVRVVDWAAEGLQ